MDNDEAYGMWWLVLVNSIFFIVFALSFTRPRTARDWRSLGAFSAFIVALFAEMYGFPLSIYLLSGWLASHYPEVDPFAHDTGHFWHTLLGRQGPAHSDPLHIVSEVLIFVGLIVVAVSWRVLYWAQQDRTLATTGLYALIRHPQYTAFILIMLASSVVSVISAEELTAVADTLVARHFRSFEVYLVVTGMYLVMCLAFQAAFGAIHRALFSRWRVA